MINADPPGDVLKAKRAKAMPVALALVSVIFAGASVGAASAEDATGPYEAGVAAFEQGNYDTAIEILLPLAEQGDAAAQTVLGQAYFVKPGYNDDVREAEKWFRRAAEKGVVQAQFALGVMYGNRAFNSQSDGFGDYSEAEKWYRLAAEGEFAPAQMGLARLLIVADKKRGKEAFQWLMRAASQGYVDAYPEISMAYRRGKGVEKDLAEALKWARLAAENGHTGGYWDLAKMYEEGLGVPQDNVQTYMWYELVVQTNGDRSAAIYRDTVASRMTQEQIAEAQRLARDWMATRRQ